MQPKQTKLVGLGALTVVVIIAVLAYTSGNKPTALASTETRSTQVSTAPPASSSSSTATSAYKDGTYAATGTYDTPGGQASVGVTLTLKSGTISDSSVVAQGQDHNSKEYQAMFISDYRSQVVGKKLDEVNLSQVSGSSLTPQGFNNAVEQIKAQAKA